ncbi:DUF4373 domain-containing protein [Anthropogastromicrobium aceti]|uniref:DUF4373 domain-containing protein n=1 Tax=Anthropogastromicrobium aceti TaxID=2981768 RepID=UPI0008216EAD|nr:DUF4373 domain-containing protein [Anthropogastromicrobium aceti]MCU6783900.1 DUF4373 domain-containing protein [Anthropogastromicrobium aceti]SCJ49783.1 Uncharacterised protein [uncultured Lachnospira sp.]
MARPRKQTVDYFPHFVGTDSKTKFILENNWGNDGYAFWFKMLELLGRSDGHSYDCSVGANWLYLISLTRVSKETASEILGTLAELGKIDKDLWEKHRIIWCQRLVDNLQQVYAKRSVQMPRKPVIESEANTEKEVEAKPEGGHVEEKSRDGEKPEPKKKAKRKSVLTVAQQELFDRFYASYPKKQDRASAEKAWARIEPQPDEQMTEQIIEAIEQSKKYDSRFRAKQFTPLPASWLNAKGYLNEFMQEGGDRYGNYDSGFETGTVPINFKPSGGFKGKY